MEEECYCNSFSNRFNSIEEIFKALYPVCSSKFKKGEMIGEKEKTYVLKCKKCNSYYLWDKYKGVFSEDKGIIIRKYLPKTDDKGLKMILKTMEGIVDERDIDDTSQLLGKLRKIELNRIDKRRIDENKN